MPTFDNRARPAYHYACRRESLAWNQPLAIERRVSGRELELAIPRSVLRDAPVLPQCDFKWVDNTLQTGEACDFTLNGDAAPNDRFDFRVLPAMPHP
ncbi:MAG: hypothetical protein FJ276_11810 [Planctomycetes bacterium]|nr:hypothetical protein [Planctomycetota bacterium]